MYMLFSPVILETGGHTEKYLFNECVLFTIIYFHCSICCSDSPAKSESGNSGSQVRKEFREASLLPRSYTSQ